MIGRTNAGVSAKPKLTSIAVTTQPTKTEYNVGDAFDKSGMEVTAYFDDGSSAVVTGYTYSPTTVPGGSSNITLSYTVDDVTKTTEVAVHGTLWLYKNGDECTSVTGGWIAKGILPSANGKNKVAPTITRGSTSITATIPDASTYRYGRMQTSVAIDMSPFTKLTAVFSTARSYGIYSGASVGVGPTNDEYATYVASAAIVGGGGTTETVTVTNQTVTVSLSSVNASYGAHIQLSCAGASSANGCGASATMTAMYLS